MGGKCANQDRAAKCASIIETCFNVGWLRSLSRLSRYLEYLVGSKSKSDDFEDKEKRSLPPSVVADIAIQPPGDLPEMGRK